MNDDLAIANESAARRQAINDLVNAARHMRAGTKLHPLHQAMVDTYWDGFLSGGIHLKHFHRGQRNAHFSIYLFLSGSQVCVGYVLASDITGVMHESLMRFADVATLFFWKYRRSSRPPKNKDFIFDLAQAQADLTNHPDWNTHFEKLEQALLAHQLIFPMEEYRSTMRAHRSTAAKVGSARSRMEELATQQQIILQHVQSLDALHTTVSTLLTKLDSHPAVISDSIMTRLGLVEQALLKLKEQQTADTAKLEQLYERLSARLDDLTVKIETLSASL